MPLRSQDEILNEVETRKADIPVPVDPQAGDGPDHSVGETFGAAFRTENEIGSAITKSLTSGLDSFKNVTDRSFNPLEYIIGYEDRAEQFAFAKDEEEIEQIKTWVDNQRADRQLLSESGFVGFAASMAAGIASPTMLIPGTIGAKMGMMGMRTARGVLGGAALATTAIGVQEAGLHATQSERTPEETAFAMIGGAILGGVMGGAIGAMSKGSRAGAEAVITSALKGKDIPVHLDADGNATVSKSAGSAATGAGLKEDEGLANINETLAKNINSLFPILRSPVITGLTSKFGNMRQMTNSWFDHTFTLNKNLQGDATGASAESLSKEDHARVIQMNTGVRNEWMKYSGVTKGAFKSVRAVKATLGADKLGWKQFSDEVATAFRKDGVHDIPEVASAAKILIKEMDRATDSLKKVDILKEEVGVKTSRRYFPRAWNTAEVIARRSDLEEIFYQAFRKEKNIGDILGAKGKKAKPKKTMSIDAARKAAEKEDFRRAGLDYEARRAADKAVDNIIGLGPDSTQLSQLAQGIVSKGTRFTKQRVLDIDDDLVSEFLINDAPAVISNYLNQASALVRYQESLIKNGYRNLSDVEAAMKADAKRQEDKVSGKEAVKINKALANDIRDLNKMANIMVGQFTEQGTESISRGLRLLRKFNTTVMLGGVVITSLIDTSMRVFRHGLHADIVDGYGATLRNLKAAKASKDQFRDVGVGLELEENSILRALSDEGFNPTTQKNIAEVAADVVTDAYGKLTLLTYWNKGQKRLDAQVISAGIIRIVKNESLTGKISQKARVKLAKLGIGDEERGRVLEMFNKHGEEVDGSFIHHFETWKDKEIAGIFQQAVLRDVDATIVTPSKGDIPFVAQHTETGKTIFQYKPFISAATNRVLISGIQRRDAEVYMGLVGLIGMGMAVHIIKKKLSGQEVELDSSADFLKLMVEGATRSGTTGLMGEGLIGLNPWMGTSRYAGNNVQSMFLGPSADFIKNSYSAGRGLVDDGEITSQDMAKLKKMTPILSLFYLRALLGKVNKKSKRRKPR